MIPREIKYKIFQAIISNPNFLGKYSQHDDILAFLSTVWELKAMSSQDDRFGSAYEDIKQHYINNDDWDIEYLFIDRLKMIDNEESYFICFLENIVHPKVRESISDIIFYVNIINAHLNSTFKLLATHFFEELPIYQYKNQNEFKEISLNLNKNKIIIYKEKLIAPSYPCFLLESVSWDDYGCSTTFTLTLYLSKEDIVYLGRLKIMKKDNKITDEVLESEFIFLPNDYCSLGLSSQYYHKLREHLPDQYYVFLQAIRDVALFPKIYQQFEKDSIFTNSLLRSADTEKLSRNIRYELEGINPEDYFKFHFTLTPPYAESPLTFNFNFVYNSVYDHRLFAIIGNNGTGKTNVLSTLAKELSNRTSKQFNPIKPVFGKIFTISYSVFDSFDIPTSDDDFNYVYCGLKKDANTLKNKAELFLEFEDAATKIIKENQETLWYNILSNFIFEDVLNIAFTSDSKYAKFQLELASQMLNVLSSGQSVILIMLTKILSEIKFNSLILFDEPETHLHPNAVSKLLNTLFFLAKEFDSFCIIATHSPLIVQEIPARNIYVLKREKNFGTIRLLERESLGENLTIITNDIFGTWEIPKHFISVIKELIALGKTFDEIIDILQTENLPMSSNIKLHIKALSANSK